MKLLRTPDDMPPSVPLEAYQGEATDGAPLTAYSGIESTPDFLRRAIPPRYIVDGVIQANRLYSLCGFTGHAKTSLALKLAFCVARGVVFGDKETEQGSVLFLAGENADNVITQYQALLIAKGVKPESVPVFWHYGNFRLKDSMAALKADAENIPDLRLIIVDTLQAFFPGDNDNDNMQMLEAARQFRPLNSLPGNPTVIVLCHPSGKRPDKSNLVPRGGGAFLNEVDGNFSVWRDADGAITLHTQGKHRGAWFDPM
ncbi:MAG: AAA family ATPase, partial [Ferruginibacter sp.]